MASIGQTKKIHTLLNVLGLDDDTYRDILSTYGVTTSKALNFKEAGDLIDRLETHALCTGRWRKKSGYAKRFDNLGKRQGMATPAQLRNIEGLWFDVTRQGTREQGLKALRIFLNNHFGISDMALISSDMVKKILSALKTMKKQSVKADKSSFTKENEEKIAPNKTDCKIFNIQDYRGKK